MSNSENTIIINSEKPNFLSLFYKVTDYKDLFYYLFKRDFIGSYKQSVLGGIWFFVQPITMCLVYYFIFSKVAKLETSNAPPLLFYMSGIIFWGFFGSSVSTTSSAFMLNAHLFQKVYFPRVIAPLSSLATLYFKMLVQLIILVAMVAFYYFTNQYDCTLNIFKIIYGVLLLTLTSLGIGFYTASISVKYHDFRYISGYVVQLSMYITTVVYPYTSIPENYKKLMFFNPLSHIFEFIRSGLVNDYFYEINGLILSSVFAIVVFVVGARKFNITERNFVDQV